MGMTKAGLHRGAEPCKGKWVGALFLRVISAASASCSQQSLPRSFLEGLLHSVMPGQEAGSFQCLESQHSRPMCNVPRHQFGVFLFLFLMPLQPLDSPLGGGGVYDMMPEPELGTSDRNGKFSLIWD